MKEHLKLVYDISSLPKGLDPGNMTKIYEQHHVIYWDSKEGGTKPALYGIGDKKLPLMIVDMEGKSLNVAQYSQDFKDDEFWDKELHKCQNSPLYFWGTYGTPVFPHTNDGLKAYLKEIGLVDITEKDSEKAAEAWEKQKSTIKKVTDAYTIEFLKERQAALDVMRQGYELKAIALESLLEPHARLFDTNKAPLELKKRITVLTEKISKHYPVLEKYSDIYRNKKGKWDRPILHNTDYVTLMEMYYDILIDEGRITETVDSKSKELAGAIVDTK
jgi:hypothetical protein